MFPLPPAFHAQINRYINLVDECEGRSANACALCMKPLRETPSSLSLVKRRVRPRMLTVGSRLGLQGRIVICFIAVMLLTLGATVFTFVNQTGNQLNDLIGEHSRQLSSTLALANEGPVRLRAQDDLNRIAKELIKSRNVLYVAFFDDDGHKISMASRDADIDLKDVGAVRSSTSLLMQVHHDRSAVFGEYLETTAPVLSQSAGPSKLVGYVSVGVSRDGEAARMNSIIHVVVLISALALTLAMLVGTLLVHRIFMPIRELVHATHKIIGGDLDTRVAIERGDTIGQLARAFNEMVEWVKQQQRDLNAANQSLMEANRDLEAKVAHRTGQLEAANNRLSAEISEKEEFLRAVSHDLGAPLRNIDGMATVLLLKHRDTLNADVVHRLERIKKNVEMESSLIAELLELSRIKTRRHKVELVELDGLILQLRDMFDEDLRSQGIELVVETPLPTIDGERLRLRQLFQNLIDNAIKYMGEPVAGRARRISIGCAVRMTEAEFYVRDTGLGIHEDDLGKVFLVFRRGRNINTGNIAGKGVGLASVKSIVEIYSGRIWVESTLGEGSTFKFTINGRHVRSGEARQLPKAA